MRKAVDSATKWLTEKVKANPKLNPIPYAFFKSIINKQIEWAGKRGVSLDFEELSQAVRSELLKSGIYTMADKSARQVEDTDTEARGAIPPLLIRFNSTGEAIAMTVIFDWLRKVFNKAHAENYSELELSVRPREES